MDRRVVAVVAVAALSAAFFAGYSVARSGVIATPEVSNEFVSSEELRPLFTGWRLLEENFASASSTESISTTEKIYGALKGLAASYGDPYTTFFPPVENENFATQIRGDFGGVGMEIGQREGILVVIAPIKDTPASRAGIKAGDLILAINEEDTTGMSVDEAVGKIRGPKGTTVDLILARAGEPYEVTVTRDTIVLPTIDTELRPDGVFVLSLYNFDAKAPQLFRAAIREFADSGTDKLLVDLRGNPGGYLEAAVDMVSWFLPPGLVVVTQAYQNADQNVVSRSYGYNVFTDKLKMAIVIDGGSASAAEIFAGALQQHGKAKLIGTHSFGKGSVQQLFPVTPDTSLKITIARWLTPNGTSISNGGLAPDITVEIGDEDREAGRDPQLDRAVQYLLTGN